MNKFNGCGVALVTPFDNNNQINYDKLYELIDFHIKNKTDYLVICGTTGESSSLSFDEKCELISKCIKYAKGKIKIVCGTGSNNTINTIKLSKFAKLGGTDAVLVVSPYYVRGNDEGIYLHYKKIADAIFPTPVILYNVPTRTGQDLSVDLITRLACIENIVAIKEANTSLEKVSKILNIIKSKKLDFDVICGNDILTPEFLSIGAVGTISVCANIIPEVMHKICTGDTSLFYDYYDLIDVLSIDVNPIMIKEALNYLGYNVGKLRLPLHSTTSSKLEIMKKIIDRTNF